MMPGPVSVRVSGSRRSAATPLTASSRSVQSSRTNGVLWIPPAGVVPGVLAGVAVANEEAVAGNAVGEPNRQREGGCGRLCRREANATREDGGDAAAQNGATGSTRRSHRGYGVTRKSAASLTFVVSLSGS